MESTGIKTFECNGNKVFDVYTTTNSAVEYSRKKGKPSIIVYNNLKRRFGHAATDRQTAYLTDLEIEGNRKCDNLEQAVLDIVGSGEVGWEEIRVCFEEIGEMVEEMFNVASEEDKVTSRSQQIEQASQPRVHVPRLLKNKGYNALTASGRKDIMRKNMNKAYAEILEENERVVYLGEDVEHGGYYLVTDDLKDTFPRR